MAEVRADVGRADPVDLAVEALEEKAADLVVDRGSVLLAVRAMVPHQVAAALGLDRADLADADSDHRQSL